MRPDRWFLIYRQNGTVTVNQSGTIDILLVGGGGGGGRNNAGQLQQGGGGGGGGGVVYKTSFSVTPGTYQVTVGEGGAIGANGGNTTVSGFGLTAYGGGAGANYGGHPGNDGASGGGSTSASGETQVGGAAIYGSADNLGNAGGGSEHLYGAGGGGGAGTVGNPRPNPGNNYRVGIGGDGILCPILDSNAYYGGGGAGYRYGAYPTDGGKGGGGNNTGSEPVAGTDGLGGGGNGGARGGSGVVIISFAPSESIVDSSDFLLTGGDEILPVWDDTVLVFRQSGTLTVTGEGNVEILAVGGGGGGGSLRGTANGCGGGGAGGFVHLTDVPVIAGTYAITVGKGGGIGTNGEDTVVLGIRSFGGGAGAQATGASGNDGASGGGASSYSSETRAGGSALYLAYGNLGNAGGASGHVFGSGGGGGAGAQGGGNDGSSSTPGAGGDGTNCCITGLNVWYAGGGAGYRENSHTSPTYTSIPGGKGGGGAFGKPGEDGFGGGGSGNQPGGSGIVAIRYRKRIYVDEFKDATGGAKTHIPGYDIHTFTTDGTFTMPCAGKVEVLLVGGGGGGGSCDPSRALHGGGGGGAGGVIITNLTLAAGTHAITIGSGGEVDANGGDTVAFGFKAFGGGAGARYRTVMSEQNPPGFEGNPGASGGGAAYYYYYTNLTAGGVSAAIIDGLSVSGGMAIHEVDANLGHAGGAAVHPYGAGGGGGAGTAGGETQRKTPADAPSLPGVGGDGVACSITGTETYYGGGGAGYRSGTATAGGLGGGGACLADGTAQAGTDGLGGGGCGGAKGGSGIVIIRYKLPPKGVVINFR